MGTGGDEGVDGDAVECPKWVIFGAPAEADDNVLLPERGSSNTFERNNSNVEATSVAVHYDPLSKQLRAEFSMGEGVRRRYIVDGVDGKPGTYVHGSQVLVIEQFSEDRIVGTIKKRETSIDREEYSFFTASPFEISDAEDFSSSTRELARFDTPHLFICPERNVDTSVVASVEPTTMDYPFVVFESEETRRQFGHSEIADFSNHFVRTETIDVAAHDESTLIVDDDGQDYALTFDGDTWLPRRMTTEYDVSYSWYDEANSASTGEGEAVTVLAHLHDSGEMASRRPSVTEEDRIRLDVQYDELKVTIVAESEIQGRHEIKMELPPATFDVHQLNSLIPQLPLRQGYTASFHLLSVDIKEERVRDLHIPGDPRNWQRIFRVEPDLHRVILSVEEAREMWAGPFRGEEVWQIRVTIQDRPDLSMLVRRDAPHHVLKASPLSERDKTWWRAGHGEVP